MDVTPSPKMFEAMQAYVDATIGEAPTVLETTPAAERRRDARRQVFDFLHGLVRLSMREGVGRYCKMMGLPAVEDVIKPDPVSKMANDAIEKAAEKLIGSSTH